MIIRRPRAQRAVRRGKWKYLWDGFEFLYDLDRAWPFWLASGLMVVVLLQSRGLREGRLGSGEPSPA